MILASNQRPNIDDAFVRRLRAIVRYEIWRRTFPPQIAVADDIDWNSIADRYELTGGGILNVTQYCALDVLSKRSLRLDLNGLEAAIQREYLKEGKLS